MRKEMKLDVEEFVQVQVAASAMLTEYFKIWREHIMKEVRAKDLEFVNDVSGDVTTDWKVESEALSIGITSLKVVAIMKAFAGMDFLSEESVMTLAEAGISSPEDLGGMTEDDLAAMGLSRQDAKRIVKARPNTVEVAKSDPALPRDEMVSILLEVPHMTNTIAELLYDNGFDSPKRLKHASEDELRKAGIGSRTIEELKTYFGNEMNEKKVENAPVPEIRKDIELEGSFTYLIKEERSDKAYELLQTGLGEGMRGFCVTRNYPLKVRSKYGIGDIPILWLSNIGKEDSIRPKDLEKLSMALENFLLEEGGMVLMEGIEYLITNNSFLTVLRFLQSLRDQVAISHAVLLISVNPSTLEENEVNLLEKEVDVVVG
jgi:hypothetical protein